MQLPYRFVNSRLFLAIVVGAAGWFGLTLVMWNQWQMKGLIAGLALQAIPLFFILFEILMRLVYQKRRNEIDIEQMQILCGLYPTLKPEYPLFDLRRHAMSPDSLALYQIAIAHNKPKIILELGSGISTVVSSLTLKRLGVGRVIALDDSEKWAENTRTTLQLQGSEEYAEVRYAPLVKSKVGDRSSNWYDLDVLKDINKIDLLLIDGPVDSDDEGLRYPALPLLADKLSEKAIIFADDCFRPNWKSLVLNWASDNSFTVEEPYPNEKNTIILKRGF